jgi:hypothetical protein
MAIARDSSRAIRAESSTASTGNREEILTLGRYGFVTCSEMLAARSGTYCASQAA